MTANGHQAIAEIEKNNKSRRDEKIVSLRQFLITIPKGCHDCEI